MTRSAKLGLIKLAHTAVWAFFASCILAIPVFAARESFRAVAVSTALVFGEVAVLAFNHWRCPLTGVAARYTEDRRPNFDIYLPTWMARHNKGIFGSLFVTGLVFSLLRWLS